MTALISRPTLRAAVLAAVAAGAVLVPSAAFADASPKPSEPAAVTTPSPERSEAAAEAPRDAAAPSAVPRGGVAAGDRPAPAPKEAAPSVTPRGGVAAGERPAGSGDNSAAVLAGSVAGAALLAGAGTLVLRRRSAAGHNG
ncbi:hypothetical protein PV749_33320 [Streptomyces sp. ID03-2B]|uniref:hypothetical protein n=1 Tax=Streptomyces TaxID=1883 RepID=UPI0029AD6D8B|nr:hypothetical protein [Streptomyces sp. ID03-2B]WKN18374.1 hypothetical protein NEH83_31835 [Streptomyces sp. JUS-F4]